MAADPSPGFIRDANGNIVPDPNYDPLSGSAPPPTNSGPNDTNPDDAIGAGYGRSETGNAGWLPWNWGDKEVTWRVDPALYQYGMTDYAGQMLGAGARYQSMNDQAMQMALARAQGQNLVADEMAKRQLALGQGALSSQAASAMRGGYDPATQRAAMYAGGQMAGNVAGEAALAGAQEAAAAQQQYLNATGAARGMDMQQMQQALAMMQSEKINEWQARVAYERAARAGIMGGQNIEGEGSQLGKFAATALATYYGGPAAGKAVNEWASSSDEKDH